MPSTQTDPIEVPHTMWPLIGVLQEVVEAGLAQAKGWADRGQRDRGLEEWGKFRKAFAADGVTAHPKARWSEGQATFKVLPVDKAATKAFAERHDFGASQGKVGPRVGVAGNGYAGCIAPGAYHLVDGTAPDYDAVSRSLSPTEARSLSAVCTDRRNWILDRPKRVGGTEFEIVGVCVPWSRELKVVACSTYHRRQFGFGYQAEWCYDVAPTETDQYHSIDPATEASPARAPWEVIDVVERHAFAWASQWRERLVLDEEHTWGTVDELAALVSVPTVDPYRDRKVTREVAEHMDRSATERRAARRSERAGTTWVSKVDRKALSKALRAPTWQERTLLLEAVMANARSVEARAPLPTEAATKVVHGGARRLGAGPDDESPDDDGFGVIG